MGRLRENIGSWATEIVKLGPLVIGLDCHMFEPRVFRSFGEPGQFWQSLPADLPFDVISCGPSQGWAAVCYKKTPRFCFTVHFSLICRMSLGRKAPSTGEGRG